MNIINNKIKSANPPQRFISLKPSLFSLNFSISLHFLSHQNIPSFITYKNSKH